MADYKNLGLRELFFLSQCEYEEYPFWLIDDMENISGEAKIISESDENKDEPLMELHLFGPNGGETYKRHLTRRALEIKHRDSEGFLYLVRDGQVIPKAKELK